MQHLLSKAMWQSQIQTVHQVRSRDRMLNIKEWFRLDLVSKGSVTYPALEYSPPYYHLPFIDIDFIHGGAVESQASIPLRACFLDSFVYSLAFFATVDIPPGLLPKTGSSLILVLLRSLVLDPSWAGSTLLNLCTLEMLGIVLCT